MNFTKRVTQAFAWRYTLVHDRCLLELARANRRRLKNTIFVGITGSAGKTTAKDLSLAILGRRGPVSGNAASLNYLVEVAKVVLATKRKDRFSIIEISTSKPGDIPTKVELVQPTLGVMTLVERDHIKNFESLEAIAAEKGSLILSLPSHGVAVLNFDDPLVRKIGEQAKARRIWYGTAPEADLRLIQATSIYPDPLTLVVEYKGQQFTCVTALHGTHLTNPVMAALGLGLAAGIPIEDCIGALPEVRTTQGRMQIVTSAGGVTFLRDDHKAPLWSFQAPLDYLRVARAKRKVAVIGTISDYSLSASKVYPKIARQAKEAADLVVFVGPHALRALKARRSEDDRTVMGFTEIEDAHRFLSGELRDGDLVLLKGSNRADHLVRLLLSRDRTVTCWTRGCGWSRFCDVCPRLEAPLVVPTDPSATASQAADPAATVDSSSDQRANATPILAGVSWLIVGLGNHGDRFAGTPHNVGAEAVEMLVKQLGPVWTHDSHGASCYGRLGDCNVAFFRPATPINVCGPEIERVRRRLGLPTNRVIVVHDDADLALGDVRVKHSGSDSGHKGLRSIISATGNDGFMPRVRIGVRKPLPTVVSAKKLVLHNFQTEDHLSLQTHLGIAAELIGEIIRPHAR